MLLALLVLPFALVGGSVIWSYSASSGHRYDLATAPSAPVAIVFGAEVSTPFLTGRLDAAVALFRSGKAASLLVSGNAAGTSGDETAAMTSYLLARGVPSSSLQVDPLGVSTYDTCSRASQVFHLQRALLVTQAYHLPRAVSLCRSLGIDADGVGAPCACGLFLLFENQLREWLATTLALRHLL